MWKSKPNSNCKRLLVQKQIQEEEFREYGIKPMRFKARYSQLYDEIWWDLPVRSNWTKSWKHHRKTQYKA